MKKVVEVYESDTLEVIQLSKNTFQHISYLQTRVFGKVACNGLVVINSGEALVFDTPTSNTVSQELINWIKTDRRASIKAVVPTHYHDDCLAGLKAFHEAGIASFATERTKDLAVQDSVFALPQFTFSQKKTFAVGNLNVEAAYFGEGHTADNIIGYIPSEKVLFGGCLIKSMNASKGFLGDATVHEWSHTVEKVKLAFLGVRTVVPGHGNSGDKELLDYTISLFQVDEKRTSTQE